MSWITLGRTPLMLAVESSHAEVVEALLAAGADANRRMDGGRTVAHVAALSATIEVIRTLLAGGVDFSVVDEAGNSPIMAAIWNRSDAAPELIGLLGAAGTALDIGDRSHTPLSFAAEQGYETLVDALLDAGAPVAASRPDGTPNCSRSQS